MGEGTARNSVNEYLCRHFARLILPPPRYKISEFAAAEAYLPAEGNSEPGRYRLDRMPWQREALDDPLDPTIQETVWMWASQTGKTLCIILVIAYFIKQIPCKILVVYPKLADALDWLRDKMLPTIKEIPCMEGLMKDPREKDSESRALNRKFPGGGLVAVGSISTSSLRRLSARGVVQDEIDDFETTPQGDSMALADKRAETFHNAWKLKSSTPTHKGSSRVEALWERSDKRRFFVPCQICGHMQHLRWEQFKFTFTRDGREIRDTEGAVYECEACKGWWNDQQRLAAIYDKRAEWRATALATKIRGRHLNGLYRVIGKKSAFKNYHHEFAEAFLEAKKGGRETMMVWVNTFLAETWADPTKEIDWHPLMDRREDFGPQNIPEEVALIRAAIDVQSDRVEIGIMGWGDEEEMWWLENYVVHGDFDMPHVQQQVVDFLLTEYDHPSGAKLRINATAIDSGHKTKAVYRFCAANPGLHPFAVKGSATPYAALVTPSTKRHYGITLFMVGTDTAKDMIFSRLEITDHGPRFIHFPLSFAEKFFRQLCSEKIVETFEKGVFKRQFVKTQARNEALDKLVYALACYDIWKPNMLRVKASMGRKTEKVMQLDPEKKMPQPEPPKPDVPRPQLRPQRKPYFGGFYSPLGIR
jgi:phage terminase large subunit GpA-like protein